MINFDYDKCVKCMKCVNVCPFTVLHVVDGKPALNEEKNCIECMHCGAVCPQGAVNFDGEPASLDEALYRADDGFAESLRKHIISRRSYRHFGNEPVPRALIREAIEAASFAPSAKNQHSTGWIVVDSPEILSKMMEYILRYVKESGVSPEIVSEFEGGNNVVMGTAPTLLLAYARDKDISPETDTAIAMTSVELYLQARGIGTCWGGYLKRMVNAIPEVRALLPGIPECHSFYGTFMLGYPKGEEYLHLPRRTRNMRIDMV